MRNKIIHLIYLFGAMQLDGLMYRLVSTIVTINQRDLLHNWWTSLLTQSMLLSSLFWLWVNGSWVYSSGTSLSPNGNYIFIYFYHCECGEAFYCLGHYGMPRTSCPAVPMTSGIASFLIIELHASLLGISPILLTVI